MEVAAGATGTTTTQEEEEDLPLEAKTTRSTRQCFVATLKTQVRALQEKDALLRMARMS